MEDRTTIQVPDKLRKRLKALVAKRDVSYGKLLEDMIDVFTELDRSKTVISIPTPLAEKLKERAVKNGAFTNLSDFVTFVLRIIASEEKNLKSKKIDEKKLLERLRTLGYIA